VRFVISEADADKHETLVWHYDGFCWLRGINGEERDFSGKFISLPEARVAAEKKGFKPTAWLSFRKPTPLTP
jgi:hypothetical protein